MYVQHKFVLTQGHAYTYRHTHWTHPHTYTPAQTCLTWGRRLPHCGNVSSWEFWGIRDTSPTERPLPYPDTPTQRKRAHGWLTMATRMTTRRKRKSRSREGRRRSKFRLPWQPIPVTNMRYGMSCLLRYQLGIQKGPHTSNCCHASPCRATTAYQTTN